MKRRQGTPMREGECRCTRKHMRYCKKGGRVRITGKC